jgi:ATP-dependent Clp protease ATP-binding subunit ClpA
VQPENLFFALVRDGRSVPLPLLLHAGADADLLRQSVDAREALYADVAGAELPLSVSAAQVVEEARTAAAQRKRGYFSAVDLLVALLSDAGGVAAGVLVAAGADIAKLQAEVEKM